ncbi:MAG: restriction endonuclease subunit S [Campylobacteraceae bacterium]|nr:restriction endonuclease subunit S [Campylobacteraceae bacterium]
MNKMVTIPDVLFFQEGPGVRKSQFTNKGVKLLNVGNINNNKINLSTTKKYISEEEAYQKYSHFLVDDGDLLIACSGIVINNFHNKISFITESDLPLCLNTSTMRFKSLDENKLHINFFYYFLMTTSFKKQIGKLITGSAQLNFGPSHIKKIKLHLPTLTKQKEIASVLDKAQELISLRKESIKKLDELSKSVFIDMFGDPVSNPKKIKLKKISEFTNVKTGKTPSRDNPIFWKEGTELWATTTEVNSRFIYDTNEKITVYAVEKNNLQKFEPDTILMAMYGQGKTRGKVALLKNKSTINQAFCAILKNDTYNTVFLFSLLENMYSHIRSLSRGGNQKNLNLNIVKDIKIIFPDLNIQNKFAKIIEKIEEQKSLYEEELNKLEENFKALLQKSFN